MIDQKLQLFLEKELLTKWSKRIIFTPEMKLYKDFGLVGDDVEDFLIHFMKEFNVSISDEFNFDERFYPEAYSLIDIFTTIFNTVKNLFSERKTKTSELKDLSIVELQETINKGILK